MEIKAKMTWLDNEYVGNLYCYDNYELDGTIDIDFGGHYLIQFKEDIDGNFIPTGNGIDGRGDSMPSDFYDNSEFEIEVIDV